MCPFPVAQNSTRCYFFKTFFSDLGSTRLLTLPVVRRDRPSDLTIDIPHWNCNRLYFRYFCWIETKKIAYDMNARRFRTNALFLFSPFLPLGNMWKLRFFFLYENAFHLGIHQLVVVQNDKSENFILLLIWFFPRPQRDSILG